MQLSETNLFFPDILIPLPLCKRLSHLLRHVLQQPTLHCDIDRFVSPIILDIDCTGIRTNEQLEHFKQFFLLKNFSFASQR